MKAKKFLGARVAPLLFCACVPLVVGCSASRPGSGPAASQTPAQPSEPAQASPQTQKPKTVTPDDLKRLRWIEGAWRGTGDVEKPFYERYRFDGDTALVVESFPDETLAKADDATRFELRDGVFAGGGDGARWAASALDENSITFSPVEKARNTFTWRRVSADEWQAVLDFPAGADKPARRRVYRMERVAK